MINEKPHYGFAHVGGRGNYQRTRKPLAERLAKRLDKSVPSGCWEWRGYAVRGYGQINDGAGARVLTHRVAWQLANGPIPDGLLVLHRCDNPPCCNPNHLFLGTDADNRADAVQKGRASRKLSGEDVLAIRVMAGSNRQIAAVFGISHAMVGHIKRGESWSHL